MADTTYAYTPGTGAAASIDRIAGTDYPHYKIKWGPPGTVNDTDVATGKPLPIQLRGSDGTDRSNLLPVSISGTPSVSLTGTTNNVVTELGQLFGVAPTGTHKAPSMVVRADTPSVPHASGTYSYLQTDSAGKLWTNIGVQLGGTGANSATTQRMAIVDEQLGTLVLGSVPVITGGSDWYRYAPGTSTFTPIQAAAGAAGDYLEAVLAIVTTTASQIQVRDSASGSAFDILPAGVTTIGTIPIALGWRSKAGRWEISTGAGVGAIVSGKFS